MAKQETNKPSRVVDEISSDLDAIRKLDVPDMRLTWGSAFAVVLLLVTVFIVLVWISTLRTRGALPAVYSERVTIDENYSDGQWAGTALEQALQATLRSSDQIQLTNDPIFVQTGERFGAQLGGVGEQNAQWTLKAALNSMDDGVINARIELTNSKDPSTTFKSNVVGSERSIADLAARCVEQINVWLELDHLTGENLSLAKNEIPAFGASQAYGKGLAALANNNAPSAIDYFQTALGVAPNNATVLEGLARAWLELGYLNKSIEFSKQAYEASSQLSRKRQLELEAQYAMATESWPRAHQVFAALKEFNPLELNYHLPLSETLARQNLGDEFLQSIEHMRALPDGLADDPRIDLTEAWYWYSSGDYARCATLSERAKQKALSAGNQQIVGEALLGIGRCDDSFDPTVLLEARAIFKQLAISSREPEILRKIAKHEYAQGNMKQYLAYSEEAVALSKVLGNQPQLATSNNSLAQVYDLHGWLERGLTLKERVADYQLQRGNMNRYSIMQENISISLFKLGRYDAALHALSQAETVFLQVDDKIGTAWLPYRRGQIALRRGDIEGARQAMEQAHKNAEERPEGNLAQESKYELGLIHFYAGEYAKARKTLEETLAKYEELELNLGTAENLIALARLDREEGYLDKATDRLGRAESILAKEAAYYSLSLATELTVFYSDTDDIQQRCEYLEQLTTGQEHAEYVLRARIKLVVCAVLLQQQSPEVSLIALKQLQEQAQKQGVYDALLASHYAQVAIYEYSNQHDKVVESLKHATDLAASHSWHPHPLPDLKTDSLVTISVGPTVIPQTSNRTGTN